MATPLTKDELIEEFRAGVTATLRSWSALRTASESGWGGGQSQEKAEVLRQSIYEHLNESVVPPKMDVYDLEDALAIYMEEEFSITLEDNSERQVADTLIRMHNDCFGEKHDPTLCRQIVEAANLAAQQIATMPIQVQTTEHDDDDDDMPDADDMMSAAAQPPSLAQSYASEALFGGPSQKKQAPAEPARQLGESAPSQQMEPDVDDDGFASVVTKKKKGKSKPDAM
jgi:pre-rRNA-processing protein TSR2